MPDSELRVRRKRRDPLPFICCSRRLARAASVVALAYAAVHGPMALAQSQPIPREHLFGESDCLDARISPDGSHIAILAFDETGFRIDLRVTRNGATRVLYRLLNRPSEWQWARNSEQILITHHDYIDGTGSLSAVEIEDGRVQQLISDVRQLRIVAASHDHPDEVLVTREREAEPIADVWRLKTTDGTRELWFRNIPGFAEFLFDADFALVLGILQERDGGRTVLAAESSDEWIQFIRWDRATAITARPIGMSTDGTELYFADAPRDNTAGVYLFRRSESGGNSYTPIADHSEYELHHALFQPLTGRLQAVFFGGDGMRDRDVRDSFIARDLTVLDSFRDGRYRVLSRDRRDHTWVVKYEAANEAPEFFVYRRGDRRLEHIGLMRPMTLGDRLVESEQTTLTARDGHLLTMYVTRPLPESDATAPLPTVITIRDGLTGSTTEGQFDPLCQFFVSRGCAHITFNCRGSRGVDNQFADSVRGELTGAAADDVIDIALWAVETGLADPDRIILAGEGFGGALALAGASFTPEFYAGAIAINAPVDLDAMLSDLETKWPDEGRVLRARLGADSNPRLLESSSPLTRARDVVRPLLVIDAAWSRWSQPERTSAFVEDARKNGAPVAHFVFTADTENLRDMLASPALIELFLERHFRMLSEEGAQAVIEASSAERR